MSAEALGGIFAPDPRPTLLPTDGGQYSATGVHPDCPERYRGRAYVNNDQWDITALGDCTGGTHCPVSPTFTDEQVKTLTFSNFDASLQVC